jgi:DnaJ-class molecular chaperone
MDMGGQEQRRTRRVQDGTQICQRCGGSGMLRLGDQSFRTCLECLGQGRLPSLSAATTTAGLRQVEPTALQLNRPRPLNGATASASAAR